MSIEMTAHDTTPVHPTKSFEQWASEKFSVEIDKAYKFTGVRRGDPKHKEVHRRKTHLISPASTGQAALLNAARTFGRVPIGRLMTEVEFDKLVSDTRAISIA